MKTIKVFFPAAILTAGLLLNLTPGLAKPEYMKKEKKSCLTCHVKMKSKELTKTGECYGKKKTLDGCTESDK